MGSVVRLSVDRLDALLVAAHRLGQSGPAGDDLIAKRDGAPQLAEGAEKKDEGAGDRYQFAGHCHLTCDIG